MTPESAKSSATTSNHLHAESEPILEEGIERHATPAGDGQGLVTKKTSDQVFGPDGLGFADSPWMALISWLARNGISKQSGSRPNETNITNCVKGWGQGAFSSRVFRAGPGVDRERLARLIAHLQALAESLGDPERRITGPVLGVYVASQEAQPYLTVDGLHTLKGWAERAEARFRSHIQWQSLYALAGQISTRGKKEVTPELLETFFTGERPFFAQLSERRRLLRTGSLKPGGRNGPLCDVPESISLERTDKEYARPKSGFWMLARIAYYMLVARPSKDGRFD
jgi:hypothetical protein